ncbi:MAG: hypothetical protein IJV20_03635 [Prevotella sp.]|nr:hypothetical protein [Prevotella sp.]
MKKILFMSLLAGSLALTACDPVQEKVDNNKVYSSAEDILNGISFKQYADADYTTEQSDGNYIFYQTNPGRQIQVYNYLSDGSMNLLASGASGKFSIRPKRGSDPVQPVYFRALNSDGTVTEAQTTLTVFVQQELDPEIRLLASDAYGSKVWKWDPSVTGAVWGNMGYCGGSGKDVGISGNGQWWGVTSTDEFNQQLQHSTDGVNQGDGDLDAYMVFSDEGLATVYSASGSVVRQGTYKVTDFDPSYSKSEWKVGNLETTAIMWPYEINSGANIPGVYEIVYLTTDKMTLVYPDGGDFGGLGGWGEATFWHFTSNSDVDGMLNNYGTKDWTWDTSVTGVVWGNMGYCGGAGADVGISGNGQWWGVTSTDEFNQQLQHSTDGVNQGDGDLNAWMTFGNDGFLNAYDASGKNIRTSTYEVELIEGNDWKIGNLKTTAILWPYEINSGANIPGIYEIVYLTGDKMTLVYPDGGDFSTNGGWGEASFWHFKAK